ncbi:alpha/beta hydrolase [Pontibacter pamirensis]|uniref:alpha/beta hydrolase n=1 Tax=Pontibacter pamirensis TaxID=2562824 RepID=UPI001389FA3B|nr:alpha/beta hydrolase [Pontibacter pamirensis]
MKHNLSQVSKDVLRASTLLGLLARGARLFSVLFMAFFLFSCDYIEEVLPDKDPVDKADKIQPKGPNPEWAPDIDPQMLAVIEQFQSYNVVPYPMLTAEQAREEPTFKDAYVDLLRENNIIPEPANVNIKHMTIPNGTGQQLLVRTYTPRSGTGPFPVIVYYHGGGWVITDLDTYEASASALAEKTGAIVMSVAYRQAPEHMFPAAHEDAFAAYQWAREHASEIYGNPAMVATAGESAGGNLAVAVAIMARERGVQMPEHIVSIYPIADGDIESPTYELYENALFLNKALMRWFFNLYVPDWQTEVHPLISLVEADLSGLPPTTIINAEIDPLRYEGGVLAQELEAAGVPVERKVYEGVTHEFFGMNALLEEAVAAQRFAAMRLKEAFME